MEFDLLTGGSRLESWRERMAEALQGIAEDDDELADYARQGVEA